MSKKVITIFFLIVIVIVGGILTFLNYNKSQIKTAENKAGQSLIVTDQKITDNTKPFKISIIYPQIAGLDDFNAKSKNIVDKEINDFKKNSLENDKAVKDTDPVDYEKFPREYTLDISYTKGEIDENVVSIIFNVSNFEGGAHGANYFVSLNYSPKDKKEIKLADLFPGQSDYLKKISDYCKTDLTKQIIERMQSTDGTWINDGAAPTQENYSFFLINKDNILFYFPQYQIAPYVSGDFQVTFPR